MRIYLKKYLILVFTSIVIFCIDRYTKTAILQLLYQENTQTFKVSSFLNFTEIWNKGISFGFLSNYNFPPVLFIGITMVIVALILCLMKNVSSTLQGMIIGGAFGNTADRFLFGGVFDFIDLHFYGWHYPAFNLADSFIILSIILIMIKEIYL